MTFLTPFPKGHATIAQRFNAGCRRRARRVPKGQMKNSLLNRPFGTEAVLPRAQRSNSNAGLFSFHPSGMKAPKSTPAPP
jgi:hypothetical protein